MSAFRSIGRDPDALCSALTMLGEPLDVVTSALVNKHGLTWEDAERRANTARARRFSVQPDNEED